MSAKAQRLRPFFVWIAVVVVLVLVAVFAGSPNQQGGYLDPDGTGPVGLKAFRTLVSSFGARVDVRYDAAPDADVMVMMEDVIADEDLPRVESWIADGGILVVADPWSALVPMSVATSDTFGLGGTSGVAPGVCDVGALIELNLVAKGMFPTFLSVGEDDRSCFGDSQAAFVVVRSVGDGAIVAVGGPELFMNENLAEADNAALAVSLVAPKPGTRVVMLERGPNSPGSEPSLSDAMPSGVGRAITQLFAAFVVYAWFRGRRLGKPVIEPQRVQIEGSELVQAVGGLVRQARDPDAAARVLRSDMRRLLTTRLGLAADVGSQVISDVLVARTGLDPTLVASAVGDSTITSDNELLDLAHNIDLIRKEVLDGPV